MLQNGLFTAMCILVYFTSLENLIKNKRSQSHKMQKLDSRFFPSSNKPNEYLNVLFDTINKKMHTQFVLVSNEM